MTKRDIAFLSCRIIAINTFVLSLSILQYIPQYWIFPRSSDQPISSLMFVFSAFIPLILLLLVSGGLWFYADFISNSMVRNKDIELFKVEGLSSEDIRLIAYSLIGLLTLVNTIYGLVRSGVSISFSIGSGSYRMLADQLFISNILTLLVKLGIGIRLFLGPVWLENIRKKLGNKVKSSGISEGHFSPLP